DGGCKITAHGDARPFWLSTSPTAEFTHTGVWYWNFVYRREVERGYTDKEDLYLPGVVRVVLQPGQQITLVASTEPPEATARLVEEAFERETARQRLLLAQAGIEQEAEDLDAADPATSPEALRAQLVRAADSFIVRRHVEKDAVQAEVPTVIAGYHWFADWGRDTMISLPGLTLTTGRGREAAETLRAFALFLQDGMLPNNFPDSGAEPHYNTVDAALWMFVALDKTSQAEEGGPLVRELYPSMESIIKWYQQGTWFGIGADHEDGLLRAGEPGVQLTWMDAKVEDWVVTPRTGKPVEINALWYNALRLMEKWSRELEVAPTANYMALADRARSSFQERFWFESGGYLFDVVDGPEGDDASLRPNQVIALSVPDLLEQEHAREALRIVRDHLLTPYGLRTLSADDPRYIGIYTGDRHSRDEAYHNGTVWAWLLGPYFDAVAAIEGREAAAEQFSGMLPQLRSHLASAGLGSISEIFDGDEPHTPRGCISQAWSVAEVLRLATLLTPD
ncbi:MAG TPA: amylo-alpha-1,6-glucosidase, partial [Chloroflexia bacterium]|nr:amylo-alpha-1,6-glucosidase [Chloroflexia bacterium]